ncbi:hypothetical protein DL769_006252 [Monosporascus sp. CRB-8-3]|nr:hypothetical protein DL769_006252 [Monosporascus sp. CRB-8-3]
MDVNGAEDCSSSLAVTVTPATSIASSTVTVVPIEYMNVVETVSHTAGKTEKISTETDFVYLDNRFADCDGDGGTGNKCIWAPDSDGNLILANLIPPYTYKYYAYVLTSLSGSVWAQVGIQKTVQTAINNRSKWVIAKGCIDLATGELSLDAGGRKNILWCGAQLGISEGNGEDIDRGGCYRIQPKIEAV